MSRTITISEDAYTRLEQEAQAHGFTDIGQLLEQWTPRPSSRTSSTAAMPLSEAELKRRREAGDRTIALQQRLSAKYGMMSDSTDLIREDRER